MRANSIASGAFKENEPVLDKAQDGSQDINKSSAFISRPTAHSCVGHKAKGGR